MRQHSYGLYITYHLTVAALSSSNLLAVDQLNLTFFGKPKTLSTFLLRNSLVFGSTKCS